MACLKSLKGAKYQAETRDWIFHQEDTDIETMHKKVAPVCLTKNVKINELPSFVNLLASNPVPFAACTSDKQQWGFRKALGALYQKEAECVP